MGTKQSLIKNWLYMLERNLQKERPSFLQFGCESSEHMLSWIIFLFLFRWGGYEWLYTFHLLHSLGLVLLRNCWAFWSFSAWCSWSRQIWAKTVPLKESRQCLDKCCLHLSQTRCNIWSCCFDASLHSSPISWPFFFLMNRQACWWLEEWKRVWLVVNASAQKP